MLRRFSLRLQRPDSLPARAVHLKKLMQRVQILFPPPNDGKPTRSSASERPWMVPFPWHRIIRDWSFRPVRTIPSRCDPGRRHDSPPVILPEAIAGRGDSVLATGIFAAFKMLHCGLRAANLSRKARIAAFLPCCGDVMMADFPAKMPGIKDFLKTLLRT
jgi:hypothetical protein